MVDFAVTLYVTDVSLLDAIELSASSDRERWTALSYEAVERRRNDGGAQAAMDETGGQGFPEGVLALELTGSIPPELQGSFFRITIEPGELQIGPGVGPGSAGSAGTCASEMSRGSRPAICRPSCFGEAIRAVGGLQRPHRRRLE